jgi:hypothetical protein
VDADRFYRYFPFTRKGPRRMAASRLIWFPSCVFLSSYGRRRVLIARRSSIARYPSAT